MPARNWLLCDLERALIERDGTLEERALRVRGAQIEIVRRERGLGRELGVRKVRLAHLDPRLAALDLAPDRAPDVGLPASQSLQSEFRVRAAPRAAADGARHGRGAPAAAAALGVEARR